jgi:hypothetical protein
LGVANYELWMMYIYISPGHPSQPFDDTNTGSSNSTFRQGEIRSQ